MVLSNQTLVSNKSRKRWLISNVQSVHCFSARRHRTLYLPTWNPCKCTRYCRLPFFRSFGIGGGVRPPCRWRAGRWAAGRRASPPPPPPPAPPLCLQYATPHCVQHKVTTASPLPEVLFFLGSCIALALLLPSTLIPFTLIVITMTIWILQVWSSNLSTLQGIFSLTVWLNTESSLKRINRMDNWRSKCELCTAWRNSWLWRRRGSCAGHVQASTYGWENLNSGLTVQGWVVWMIAGEHRLLFDVFEPANLALRSLRSRPGSVLKYIWKYTGLKILEYRKDF